MKGPMAALLPAKDFGAELGSAVTAAPREGNGLKPSILEKGFGRPAPALACSTAVALDVAGCCMIVSAGSTAGASVAGPFTVVVVVAVTDVVVAVVGLPAVFAPAAV